MSSYYFRDKLSIKSNKILANLFAQMILLSQKVQSFRQILASVPYYDCIQLFRVLDQNQKGFINLNDFFHLTGQDHKKIVSYAFSWMDQAKLGQISRLQFISFLMPRRNSELRQNIARRIQEPVNDPSYSDTINQQLRIFTDMLNQIISHQLKIIQQRVLLFKQQDYSLKGVLNSLDSEKHQFVSSNSVLNFLKNYAIQATKQQIDDLIEIIDSRLQGKITLEQLEWLVQGLQSKNKGYFRKINSSLRNSSVRNTSLKNSSVKRNGSKQNSHKKDQENKESKESKSFLRSPLRSKIQNSRRSNEQGQSVHQMIGSNASNKNQQKVSLQNTSQKKTVKNNEQLKSYIGSLKQVQNNLKFQQILQKYHTAEMRQLQRDDELMKTEKQIDKNLKDEYISKTAQRKKRIDSQTSYQPKNVTHRQNALDIQSIRNKYENQSKSNYAAKDSRVYRSIYNEPLIPAYRSSSYYDPLIPDYGSIYDRKIDTILEKFYQRNYDATPSYLSNSKNYPKFMNDAELYRTKPYPSSHGKAQKRRSFLQQEIYRQKHSVKPFTEQSKSIKNQIQRKLGNDLHSTKVDTKYDPQQHKRIQQLITDNMRKLKQKPMKSQTSYNFSSPDRQKVQPAYVSKYESYEKRPVTTQNKRTNIYQTQIKVTPPGGQNYDQRILNTRISKNRGLETTQTRYSHYNSQNKQ